MGLPASEGLPAVLQLTPSDLGRKGTSRTYRNPRCLSSLSKHPNKGGHQPISSTMLLLGQPVFLGYLLTARTIGSTAATITQNVQRSYRQHSSSATWPAYPHAHPIFLGMLCAAGSYSPIWSGRPRGEVAAIRETYS